MQIELERTVTSSQNGRPSTSELAAVVAGARDGMSALELLDHFVNKGYLAHDVQRAIQRALNTHEIELGEHLRLYAHAETVAA